MAGGIHSYNRLHEYLNDYGYLQNNLSHTINYLAGMDLAFIPEQEAGTMQFKNLFKQSQTRGVPFSYVQANKAKRNVGCDFMETTGTSECPPHPGADVIDMLVEVKPGDAFTFIGERRKLLVLGSFKDETRITQEMVDELMAWSAPFIWVAVRVAPNEIDVAQMPKWVLAEFFNDIGLEAQ